MSDIFCYRVAKADHSVFFFSLANGSPCPLPISALHLTFKTAITVDWKSPGEGRHVRLQLGLQEPSNSLRAPPDDALVRET